MDMGPTHEGMAVAGHKGDWMERLVEQKGGRNVTLRDLAIPGTHHSGLCRASVASTPLQKIRPFAVTQMYSVIEQLNMGVRVLQFVVQVMDGAVYLSHTLRGPLFEQSLRDVAEFLREHRSETVLLIIDRDYAWTDGSDGKNFDLVYNLVIHNLGEFGFVRTSERDSDISSLSGRVVILNGPHEKKLSQETKMFLDQFGWAFNTTWYDTRSSHYEDVIGNHREYFAKLRAENIVRLDKLLVIALSYSMTFGNVIFKALKGRGTLHTEAKRLNARLKEMLRDEWRSTKYMNIVSVDFIDPDLCREITRLNEHWKEDRIHGA